MKLKNLMLLMAAAGALTACSSSDGDSITGGGDTSKYTGSEYSTFTGTQASIGVEKLGLLNATMTTRAAADYANAFVSKTADATYKVTVDPRMGYGDDAKADITNKKIYNTDVPTHTTVGVTTTATYAMSTDGTGVSLYLVQAPTVDDVKNALGTASYSYNETKKSASVNVEKNNTTYETKVIWYLVENKDNAWTVYGILTDRNDIKEVEDICKTEEKNAPKFNNSSYADFTNLYETTNISASAKDLRYDIHQQEHQTWGEIKTSLHIMQTDDVTVTLPIKNCYTLDATKNAEGATVITEAKVIKSFGQLFTCGDVKTASGNNVDVKVEVTSYTDNVVIKVSGITKDLLDAAARKYNDGITVEVHTFYKLTGDENCGSELNGQDLKSTIWTALKSSKVECNNTSVTKKGQITSAYYKDTVNEPNQ